MKLSVVDRVQLKMFRLVQAELNIQLRSIGELMVRDGSNADPAELSELIENAKTLKGIRVTINKLP